MFIQKRGRDVTLNIIFSVLLTLYLTQFRAVKTAATGNQGST